MDKIISDTDYLNSLIQDLDYLNKCEKDTQIIMMMLDRTNNLIRYLKEFEEIYKKKEGI